MGNLPTAKADMMSSLLSGRTLPLDTPLRSGLGARATGADDDNIAYRLVLAASVSPAVALAFCLVRLYTARFVVRKVYLDDYLILGSFIFALAYSILSIVQTGNGVGTHIQYVSEDQIRQFLFLGCVVANLTYCISMMLAKASIIFFYLRFAAADPHFRAAAYTVLFVAVGHNVAAGLGVLYFCRPIPALWDTRVEGHCIDLYAQYYCLAIANSVTDIVLLLLPIWLLWPLRVRKIGVALVLMPGGFVCAVSIIRIVAITENSRDPDFTWHYCINIVWCLIELYVGIICACLPCLKAFSRHLFPALFAPERQMGNMGNSGSILSGIRVELATIPGIRPFRNRYQDGSSIAASSTHNRGLISGLGDGAAGAGYPSAKKPGSIVTTSTADRRDPEREGDPLV